MEKGRIHWLDSMKVLGLLLIVAGHYAVPHYEWLYVFSVQLFYVISGFLFRKPPVRNFTNALIKQLVLPMMLLALTYDIFQGVQDYLSGTFDISSFIDTIIGIFIGNQPSLAGLWFVYTLIIIKVISYALPRYLKPELTIGCILISYYLNEHGTAEFHNCFVNTLLAYPFFYFGEFLSYHKSKIDNIKNNYIIFWIMLIGIAGIIVSKMNNEVVWMYMGQYGSNILMFLVGGVCGTMVCYGICKIWFNKHNKYVLLLAEGSILILAFQNIFIRFTYQISGYYGYILSLALLICFIPIIIFCQKYLPFLIGYRNQSNKSKSHMNMATDIMESYGTPSDTNQYRGG